MRSLLAGIAFLTRIPVARLMTFDGADVARSAGWFPLIGALLGGIGALFVSLLRGHLPSAVVAILLIVTEVMLTGALHFDGLADSADGLGGGREKEDVLRIMRDHAIGSYGATAVVLAVALKATAYSYVLSGAGWVYAVILTPALGRWSLVLLTGTLPYARSSGSVVQGMTRTATVLGTCVMAALVVAAQWPAAWVAAAAVVAVTIGFGTYCRSRISGITGDTLGANLQLSESAALLVFLWSSV